MAITPSVNQQQKDSTVIDRTNVEVSIVCDQKAVDQTFELVKLMDEPGWHLLVNNQDVTISPNEASAIAALFIGGLEGSEEEKTLYLLAEPVMAQIDDEARMIP